MSDKHTKPVDELDLLAYADGRLDRDPAHKEAVEAYLRENPQEAARVEMYMTQNNAIRAAYAGAAEDPVPQRLLDVLDRDPRSRTRVALRVGAAAAALAVAAASGWLAGRTGDERSMATRGFVEQTMFGHLGSGAVDAANAERPLVSLSQKLSLELQPPDLSAFGYQQVDMRSVGSNGSGAVRVTYADAQNRTINLFLKPRWEETAPTLRFVRRDDISMAYWLDGPLVYGLAAQIDRDALADIATHIRQANRANGGNLDQAGSKGPVVEHQGTMPATSGEGQPGEGQVQELVVPDTMQEIPGDTEGPTGDP